MQLRSATRKTNVSAPAQPDKNELQIEVEHERLPRKKTISSLPEKNTHQVVIDERDLPQKRRMLNGSHSRFRNYSSIINTNTLVRAVEGFTYNSGECQLSTELNRLDSASRFRVNMLRLSLEKRKYTMLRNIMVEESFGDLFEPDNGIEDEDDDTDEPTQLKRLKSDMEKIVFE